MINRRALLGGAAALGLAACSNGAGKGAGQRPASTSGDAQAATSGAPPSVTTSSATTPTTTTTSTTSTTSTTTFSATTTRARPATAAQIARRATVPVLCWHQLRDWISTDGEYARNLLICPPARFRAQLDALANDGWQTIDPDQYLDHLTTGSKLPAKPVLLTFDDSQGTQRTEGLPQLLAREMTATFFAMTVVLDKRHWLSRRDLHELDAQGMTIGAHTWDHHRVDQYSGKDWKRQLEQPRAVLEKIVGKPVEHFAYPYGAWNRPALKHVTAAGYRSAFQLADRTPDSESPLLTLRRTLVNSTWTGKDLLRQLDEPQQM